METRFEEVYVKNIQDDIKYACECLEELGFDSVMLIASKDSHMELGSTKGRRFIEDNSDYIEKFILYCQVKIEKQIDNIAEADAYEEPIPQVSVPTVIIGPGKKTGQLLTPKKEPLQTKVTVMTDVTSQEIDFTIEINNSFDDAIEDGDESRLQEDIENEQNQNHTIDTNNTIAKRYGNFGKGNTDGADLYEDKNPQLSVPIVTTELGKRIGKLLAPKKEPKQSKISEMSDATSQEIDFTKTIADNYVDNINDWSEFELDDSIESDQSIDTNKIAKDIAKRYNKPRKGNKAQLKKQKVVFQPAFEMDFEQNIKKRENQAVSKRLPSTSRKTFDCDRCKKKYLSKNTLIIHQRKHTGDAPYACATCGKAFRSSSFLKSHSTVHSSELKYNCNTCGIAFAWKDSLRRHHINVHSSETPHSCDTCGSSFKHQNVLRKHKMRHTGEKNHRCITCGKRFMFKHQVTEHMRVHTGIKKFECEICNQKFVSRSNALKHQNKKHPISSQNGRESERFDCDQCDKNYSSKPALIIHQRKHTGDAPYVCQTCGKAFRSRNFLKSHLTVHSSELKYNCNKCGIAFARKSSLRRHYIYIHSNERRHVCDTCGSSFKHQNELRYHKMGHTGEKNHACECCGKRFIFKNQVTEHMRVHTGIKKFECGICNQKFATRFNILKHQNKKHPNDETLIYMTK